ncbi:uncharacterized protein BJ212DRAFT_1245844, partial [Suillus subaureus]
EKTSSSNTDADLENDPDDGIDELRQLPDDEQQAMIVKTVTIKEAISEVRGLAFAIIRSTTIALPAWRQLCQDAELKPKLIPRDVITRWNSTYDTLVFALAYRQPIDLITAEKKYKL